MIARPPVKPTNDDRESPPPIIAPPYGRRRHHQVGPVCLRALTAPTPMPRDTPSHGQQTRALLKLRYLRGPGESYSDVILRLVEIEAR